MSPGHVIGNAEVWVGIINWTQAQRTLRHRISLFDVLAAIIGSLSLRLNISRSSVAKTYLLDAWWTTMELRRMDEFFPITWVNRFQSSRMLSAFECSITAKSHCVCSLPQCRQLLPRSLMNIIFACHSSGRRVKWPTQSIVLYTLDNIHFFTYLVLLVIHAPPLDAVF